ncbi:glycosyltransferase family 4 protein [Agromyces sp. NPDC056965]|uniref:glycosyltransferase family 4 protein n=1 Tax=Agromyces sp. NPDC056965 TaxID=3345983 RepID=UPI00362F9C3B
MTRIAVIVKTSEGARWIVPQIESLLVRGGEVVAVIPSGPGRLATELDRLAADERRFEVIRTPFDFRFAPRIRTLRGLLHLRRTLRRVDADAALYHLYASALASRFALSGTRTRRVHMVAGPLYLDSPVIRAVERLAAHWDDVLIAGSEYTAGRYAALGIAADRIHSIPYGVDVERFAPGEPIGAAPSPGAGQRGAFRVVMVAYVYAPKRLAHAGRGIKGHDVMLEAWSRFSRRHGEAELHFVGGGFDAAGERYRQRVISEFESVILDRGITWSASLDEIRTAYAQADLSVSPSLSENHGAALEASAMAVPSIVSDAGGLPETVLPETGWIVRAGSVDDLDSALESAFHEWRSGVLADRGLRARMYMTRRFDGRAAADRVADVVLDSGGVRR